ncbi:MAG: crossover junction endodeoxyribonuclease RuvC [Oscillospiraceae bacterium]|jgi:crossover junction endodeoxyribonuclease RuvC|nr:crossover junction endodeoxyribonuclease RuvC [Oscillospiraceae bacterium]
MKIIGIDPGYAIVGVGVLEYKNNRFALLEASAITTQAGMPFASRLEQIHNELEDCVARHSPDAMAIEKLFFNTNTTTAIDVAQARGVILLTAAAHGLQLGEYTPLQVKQSVVGYGRAEKKQVQQMVRLILRLSAVPKQDDVADALAIAICHAHCASRIAEIKRR